MGLDRSDDTCMRALNEDQDGLPPGGAAVEKNEVTDGGLVSTPSLHSQSPLSSTGTAVFLEVNVVTALILPEAGSEWWG